LRARARGPGCGVVQTRCGIPRGRRVGATG
jgi:hypothetical protein